MKTASPRPPAPAGYDVLGLGCTAVDDLLFVAEFPREDTKLAVQKRERVCGGLTATALVAAARLGVSAGYAGSLGDDPDSQFVLTSLAAAGVDTQHVVRRPGIGPVRAAIIVRPATQSRTILYDVRGALGADAKRPAASVIAGSRVLLVDRWGMPGMLRAARLARAAGRAVVGDFETFALRGFATLLALADHVIVSANFARKYTGAASPRAAAELLWAPDRAVVLVTCGADGCWVKSSGAKLARRVPAFRVRTLDTTGCGDVFHGAYAAALAWGAPLEERVRVATAAAALKATRPGGPAGCPSREEVERFLSRRPR